MVWVVLRSKKKVNSEVGRPRVRSLEAVRQDNMLSEISFFLKSDECSVAANKKRLIIILLIWCDRDGDNEEPSRDRDGRKEAATEACCPCHVSLCVCVHHASAPLRSLAHFIYYSQLSIGWERGTYHRPTRRRERWKGHNVQVDEQRGLHGQTCWCASGVRVPAFMCPSMRSVLLCLFDQSQVSYGVIHSSLLLCLWSISV